MTPIEKRLAEIEVRAAKGADRRVSFYSPAAQVCGEDIPWLVARLRAAMAALEEIRDEPNDSDQCQSMARKALDALAGEETT